MYSTMTKQNQHLKASLAEDMKRLFITALITGLALALLVYVEHSFHIIEGFIVLPTPAELTVPAIVDVPTASETPASATTTPIAE